MSLIVNLKINYGKQFFYPSNALAESFCKLLGCKTLTKEQLTLIKTMGIDIEINQERVAI